FIKISYCPREGERAAAAMNQRIFLARAPPEATNCGAASPAAAGAAALAPPGAAVSAGPVHRPRPLAGPGPRPQRRPPRPGDRRTISLLSVAFGHGGTPMSTLDPSGASPAPKAGVPRRLAFVLAPFLFVVAHGLLPGAISLLGPWYGWTDGSPGVWNLLGLV